MSTLIKHFCVSLLTLGSLLSFSVQILAEDSSENKDNDSKDKKVILIKQPIPNRPTGDDGSDTIEATIIGDDRHIGLEEQTGKCNVTVTNSITGSSFQTTVSSANPVVYNVGTSDAPLIITVETSDNISYEGVMMPE